MPLGKTWLCRFVVLALMWLSPVAATSRGLAADTAPIKVFVLAGQSNMQGHGALSNLDWLGKDANQGPLLAKLKHPDGSYRVRDDVWIHYQRDPKTLKKGNLTAGFGAGDDRIGPEWMFGQVVGDHFENPVLLIKTAWGGRSLAVDFRPPGAGGEVGATYKEMIAQVQSALKNLKQDFPELADRGHELAGFVWFQGWNDLIDAKKVAEYESNLVHLIRDVRHDLSAPKLPFVIGVIGVGGEESAGKNARMADLRKAQAAPAAMAEFQGNVAAVATAQYWDHEAHDFLTKHWVNRKWDSDESKRHFETMGNQPEYHYLGSAKIYSLIGHGLGEAMVKLHTPKFYDPVNQRCEGWPIKVDPRLLSPGNEKTWQSAFQALANHLQRVTYIVPADRLAQLRELPIWIELDNPSLGNMQYHPNRGWLLANGHDPRLVKHVHIPRARELTEPRMWAKHPYVVLHELAHAYHDQVLGFENAEIEAVFRQAIQKGIYDHVLLYTGQKVRHYALTNAKEYFAESTEAYFGVNDFYPFVRAELKEHDPEMFALLEKFWGPVK